MQLNTPNSINIAAIVGCKVAWINKPDISGYVLSL